MTRKKIIIFSLSSLVVSIILFFFINQCREKCNCPNESICPKTCNTILQMLNIDNCSYRADLPEIQSLNK